MKRMIKNKQLLALLVLVLISRAGADAQQKGAAADTGAAKLSADLSVSRQKAAQLQKALSYGSEALRALVNNTSLPFKERQGAIIRLQQERRRKLDSAFTPAQKLVYLQRQAAVAARAAEAEATVKQQREAEKKQGQAKQPGNQGGTIN